MNTFILRERFLQGLNHLGSIPPGHYPSGQIPFLAPPPGVYTVPVMATLSLPNLTLGIPIWYLNPLVATPSSQPKPYHALTPIQPVPLTSPVVTVPQPPPQKQTPIATALGKKGRAHKRASKNKASPTDHAPPPPPKPYDLCDVIIHSTHTFPKLPRVKPMVDVSFPESTVPETSTS